MRVDSLAFDHARGRAQVFEAGVGAGPDEDTVDRDVLDRGPRAQVHVAERALGGLVGRLRDPAADGRRLAWIRPPGHPGLEAAGVQAHLAVETGVGVTRKRAPVVQGALPAGAFRRHRPALEPGEGLVVGRHHSKAGAPLDAHVANGHAAFHRKVLDRRASVLDGVALSARDTDLRDQGEHHVLGHNPQRQPPFDRHGHLLRPGLGQSLGRQHQLDLGAADPERQRPESAVRGGVGVATDDQHPGLGEAQLGADHVHDPLPPAAHAVELDPGPAAVLLQRPQLQAPHLVGRLQAARGGRVVVHRGQRQVGPPDAAPAHAE